MPVPSPSPSPSSDNQRYETFVRLLVTHEAHLRSFLHSLLPSWSDVDEAMQETSLTAWRKFDQFEPGTNFLAWCAAIARFEALKQRRTRSRERLMFSDAVIDLIANEAAAENDTLAQERAALERCIAQLGSPARELLEMAYQPGVKLHEVAVRSGKGVEAFYKTPQRLRARLLDCVERQLKQEPA
jgi:RNA polymerase sigma-70 factor (ECF subfamily)